MWLFTTRGFFSVVQDREYESLLWVRARLEGDLERLRDIAPSLGPTLQLKSRDYRFRACIARENFEALLPRLLAELTYTNFKDAVSERHSDARHDIYMDVWSVMYRAQSEEARTRGKRPS